MTEEDDFIPATATRAFGSEEIRQTLGMLYELVQSSESHPSRVAAAKLFLERIAPKEDDEARRRADEERAAALAEAKSILAEFAAARLAGLYEPIALASAGAAATDNASR